MDELDVGRKKYSLSVTSRSLHNMITLYTKTELRNPSGFSNILALICLCCFLTACDRHSEPSKPQGTTATSNTHNDDFTSIDGSCALKLVSETECEYRVRDDIYLCKYSKQADSIRVIIALGGTDQVLYFKYVENGIQNKEGIILLSSGAYAEAKRKIEDEAKTRRNAQQIAVLANAAIDAGYKSTWLSPEEAVADLRRGISVGTNGLTFRIDCNDNEAGLALPFLYFNNEGKLTYSKEPKVKPTAKMLLSNARQLHLTLQMCALDNMTQGKDKWPTEEVDTKKQLSDMLNRGGYIEHTTLQKLMENLVICKVSNSDPGDTILLISDNAPGVSKSIKASNGLDSVVIFLKSGEGRILSIGDYEKEQQKYRFPACILE